MLVLWLFIIVDLLQLIIDATRITPKPSSIKDLIFLSEPHTIKQSGYMPVGFMDHNMYTDGLLKRLQETDVVLITSVVYWLMLMNSLFYLQVHQVFAILVIECVRSTWLAPNDTAYNRYKLLCKLCRDLPPPSMGCPIYRFWASRPCGPAGWLALLLIKAGDVETNPGPTNTHKQFWICDIIYKDNPDSHRHNPTPQDPGPSPLPTPHLHHRNT